MKKVWPSICVFITIISATARGVQSLQAKEYLLEFLALGFFADMDVSGAADSRLLSLIKVVFLVEHVLLSVVAIGQSVQFEPFLAALL